MTLYFRTFGDVYAARLKSDGPEFKHALKKVGHKGDKPAEAVAKALKEAGLMKRFDHEVCRARCSILVAMKAASSSLSVNL